MVCIRNTSSIKKLHVIPVNLSILVKSVLSTVLMFTGMFSQAIKKHLSRNEYIILMYHRVIDYDETVQPGMYVTPETFRLHLDYLTKHFSIISMNELVQRIANSAALSKDSKPLCVLTFDDGWIDFYQNVFPIIKQYNCPATVYLPTRFINSTHQFWTDQLANILNKIEVSDYPDMTDSEATELVKEFRVLKGCFSERLDAAAERMKCFNSEKIRELLDRISTSLGILLDGTNRDFINWDEVSEMYGSELVTFGSHTVSHEILTTIPSDQVRRELEQSKKELVDKNCIDTECPTFCYPNGNFSDEIAVQVKEAGYCAAVTTINGWNTQHSDIMKLNRIGVHQDISSSKALLAARLAGVF